MVRLRSWLALLAMVLLVAPTAAEGKFAFVVGIDDYPNFSQQQQLERAVNDANAVAATLEGLGFKVTLLTKDVTQLAFGRRFSQFLGQIQPGDMALVFYAGHGVSLDDGNYLIPADMPALQAEDEDIAKGRAVAERTIKSKILAAGARVAIVVLDACRDNPFPKAGGRGIGLTTRGLGRFEPAEGVFSLYSASEGQTALDGLPGDDDAKNSVFTRVFIEQLKKPGLSLSDLGEAVRDEVADLAKSGGADQVPAVYNELRGARFVYLAGRPPVAPHPAAPAADEVAWSFIEGTNDRKLIEALIARFPESPLRPQWEARLAALSVPPPVGPCAGVTLASLETRAAAPLSRDEECALKPKEEFRECSDCPSMVVVPPGTFTMGSPASEAGRFDNEGPQHDVTLAKAFAVGKFAVTFEEWDACVAAGGCNGYRPGDQGWGRGGRPVINVSWNDAQAYVAWLSRTTGRAYRLLSESEWEYAARAGTTTPYPWGDEIGENNANCVGCGSRWDNKQTSPVGSFAPNGFGLYDMAGNVWQWVEDCDHDSYTGAPTDPVAWTTGSCDRRVHRGGSWNDGPRGLRVADRDWDGPTYRNIDFGFRVTRTLNP